MEDNLPLEGETIRVEEIRRVLARAGINVNERHAAAIAALVREAGGVHDARLSLEVFDALRDAA